MAEKIYDVVVIGSGAGGGTLSARLAQLGAVNLSRTRHLFLVPALIFAATTAFAQAPRRPAPNKVDRSLQESLKAGGVRNSSR